MPTDNLLKKKLVILTAVNKKFRVILVKKPDDPHAVNKRLIVSLLAATELIDKAAMHCEDVDQYQRQWNLFGHVELFYDELAGEDDDTESDEDYFDDTYANRRKRRGGATPTGPGSRGGRTRKSQPDDDDTPAKRGRALAGPTGSMHCWCRACKSAWSSTGENLKVQPKSTALSLLINLVCPLLVVILAVLLASVLVVMGIWWFVSTAFSLLINLVGPLLVVILAVVCVPQLWRPLIDNYPLLANVPRNILLKLADNIKY